MIGGQLHKLAEKFHMAVICVNQVWAMHVCVGVTVDLGGTLFESQPSYQLSWLKIVALALCLSMQMSV
jgi:hypothetical protein